MKKRVYDYDLAGGQKGSTEDAREIHVLLGKVHGQGAHEATGLANGVHFEGPGGRPSKRLEGLHLGHGEKARIIGSTTENPEIELGEITCRHEEMPETEAVQ